LETGIWDAFAAEAQRDGFTIEREEVIPMFMEISRRSRAARTSSTQRSCVAR